MAEVVSINISENRGTVKHEIDCAKLIENYGIEGDAHAGRWHRQISLLAEESIDQMRALGFEPEKGAFAENINTAGIELKTIPIGKKIKIGQCILRVTQIGKECHNDCEIKRVTGKCVMPTDGIFAAVEKGGIIRKGDKITVMEDDNNWLIDTKNAVGHVLGHDITRIVKGEFKGPQFRKGHVITENDIDMLLSMGKEHLYALEINEGFLHEDDGAKRLYNVCENENIYPSDDIKEGKIEAFASCDGYFQVDIERLEQINMIEDIMIATRHSGTGVKKGDKLAGMRVIPLVVREEVLERTEKIFDGRPILKVTPYRLKTAGIITTGSEVFRGIIEDTFTPVIIDKLKKFGIEVSKHIVVDDGTENILRAINEIKSSGTDMILCTGGMSVDPDDNTPGAIKQSGANIVTYGAPVLPGAMFLLGYFADDVPIMGLPGCVMYAGATIFDIVLPKIAARLKVDKRDIVKLGNGGLCLGCEECRYPVCPFGK